MNLKQLKKVIQESIKEIQLNEYLNCWGKPNLVFGFNLGPAGDVCKECGGCGNVPCTGNLYTSKAECEKAQGLTRGPGTGTGKPGMGRDMMNKRR